MKLWLSASTSTNQSTSIRRCAPETALAQLTPSRESGLSSHPKSSRYTDVQRPSSSLATQMWRLIPLTTNASRRSRTDLWPRTCKLAIREQRLSTSLPRASESRQTSLPSRSGSNSLRTSMSALESATRLCSTGFRPLTRVSPPSHVSPPSRTTWLARSWDLESARSPVAFSSFSFSSSNTACGESIASNDEVGYDNKKLHTRS